MKTTVTTLLLLSSSYLMASPLMDALRAGDEKGAVAQIAATAQLVEPSPSYQAIHLATLKALPTVLKSLIDAGVDIDAATPTGQTALYLAARDGQESIVKLLLDAGADLNHDAPGYETPLELMRKQGWSLGSPIAELKAKNVEELKAQLAAGLDPNSCNEKGESLLYQACALKDEDIALALMEAGALQGITTKKLGQIALHKASANGMLPLVEQMLKMGADSNKADKSGLTPILLCRPASSGEESCKQMVRALCAAGANLDHRSVADANLLIFLARDTPRGSEMAEINSRFASWLIDEGIKPNETTQAGLSALSLAVMLAEPHMLEMLIKKGAKLDMPSKDGFRPIHYAADGKHADIVKLLLDAGVDPNQMAAEPPFKVATNVLNLPEKTPRDFADDAQIISLLQSSGGLKTIEYYQARLKQLQPEIDAEDGDALYECMLITRKYDELEKSIKYLQRALAQKEPKASALHANILIEQKNFKEAYIYAKQAADGGSELGKLILSNLLFEGQGCQSDPKMALRLLEELALSGDAEAMFTLGAYMSSIGELDEAFTWYERSSVANYPEGMYELARCYLQGEGCHRNGELALRLMQRASHYGSQRAKKALSPKSK